MSEEKELPKGWVETILREILPIQYGKGLVESSRDKSGQIPVYGSSGIVGFHNHALTSKATLIIGRKGSVGSVYYSKSPCWPIDTAYFVEENTNLDLKFFLYLLSFLRLGQFDKSTAVPGLSRDDYNAIKVKIAPLPEQHRIVAAIEQQFTRLDAGVAALQRAKAKLKRYRAVVLKTAVEGKLTETWRAEHPTTEPASLLLERILDERRAKWEADLRAKGKDPAKVKYVEPATSDKQDLLQLPEEWCWATLEQLSDENRAITYGVVKLGGPAVEGVPTLRSSNVRHLRFNLNGLKSISPTIASGYKRTFLQGGEILVTVRGTLGGVAVVPSNFAGYNISREVAMIACVLPSLAPCMSLFIGSPPIQTWMMQSTKGIAYTGINIETLKEVVIPLPPYTEQKQIVLEVERRLSIISELETTIEANLKRAERLRQSILREAFAGRLVPQDPTDEPASILLEHIRNERKNGHNASNKTSNGRHIPRASEPITLDVTGTEQAALWESMER